MAALRPPEVGGTAQSAARTANDRWHCGYSNSATGAPHMFATPMHCVAKHSTRTVLACAALLAGACTQGGVDNASAGADGSERSDSSHGGDGSDGSDGSDSSVDSDGEEIDDCEDDIVVVGVTPMRRITRTEYNNTVRDLLGDETAPANAFLLDEKFGKFTNNSVAAITTLMFEKYQAAAIQLSTDAIARMDDLLPCDPIVVGEDACASTFIEVFGARAYRRPLEPDEAQGLFTVYDGAQVAPDGPDPFSGRIALVIEALLQSPGFLYRPALGDQTDGAGDDGDVVALTDYEVASRLSYMIWATMPDQSLFDAAAAGELSTRDEIAAEAARMMQDGKFVATVESFHNQWLRLDAISGVTKDAEIYPSFSEELREAMLRESQAFIKDVVIDGDSRLETLFTSNESFVNRELAELYGVPFTGASDEWVRVELPAEERAGMLTHVGVLATLATPNQSSPVMRGVMIRENILCQHLPPPPPGVSDSPPELGPDATTRERYEAHTQDPICASCHRLIDGIGFGFEHYDAVGRYRDVENGKPVDGSGEIEDAGSIDGEYDGAVELSRILGSSDEVRACVGELWMEYALGRPVVEDDKCSREAVYKDFVASDYQIRELITAVVGSDAFRYSGIEN